MATAVRIYKPSKSAMQSGRSTTRQWVLEYEPSEAQRADNLMGWAGSHDTERQLKLRFPSKEEAIAYAKRNGLSYTVLQARERTIKAKSYAANFAYNRVA